MYERFAKLLEERNVTASKVAQDTGLTSTTFSEWKSGKATPKADKLLKLADYFGVPLEYFVREDD